MVVLRAVGLGGPLNGRVFAAAVATVAMTTAAALTALAPPAPASTGGVVKVAYENYGPNFTLNTLMHRAGAEFQNMYPGWRVDLEPIAAPENTYDKEVEVMSQSASTAPDVLYEDTLLVDSDIAAGYLAPLGTYVTKWPGWSQYLPGAKAAAEGMNGQIYGAPIGIDTSGLWYNKTLLQRAGIGVPWQPKSWADILSAAKRSKRPNRA